MKCSSSVPGGGESKSIYFLLEQDNIDFLKFFFVTGKILNCSVIKLIELHNVNITFIVYTLYT